MLGVEGLAFAGVDGDHRAIHRRIDTRVAQFRLGAAQAGLSLADLCLKHVDSRLGDLELGNSGLDVLIAGSAGGGKLALALELSVGQLELRSLFGELGLEVVDREAPGVQPRLLGGRVDFDQQLPLAHRVAGFHVQGADLPRGLGAHIYITPGLQGAQSRDAAFDVCPGDRDGSERLRPHGQGLPGQQAAQAKQAQASENQLAAGGG